MSHPVPEYDLVRGRDPRKSESSRVEWPVRSLGVLKKTQGIGSVKKLVPLLGFPKNGTPLPSKNDSFLNKNSSNVTAQLNAELTSVRCSSIVPNS